MKRPSRSFDTIMKKTTSTTTKTNKQKQPTNKPTQDNYTDNLKSKAEAKPNELQGITNPFVRVPGNSSNFLSHFGSC